MTKHVELNKWVTECAALCQPDKIVWIDGSEEQREALRIEACTTGELLELNQDKLPGCYYHRTSPTDVARTEHQTYTCTTNQEDAGPTNNWMGPSEGYRKAAEILKGSMRGRTMYVIPFSLGPTGSVFSKIGVELTDSIYVVLNMAIMVRCGKEVLDKLGENGGF
ncbi:MAG TPA: phosphoenolpyruvate carboxykinase, partial [Syntrophobacteraceae bacterium]|nr:phosphoenolpyruvate carboxykinase [Syntrophobacteraceae bacterium]